MNLHGPRLTESPATCLNIHHLSTERTSPPQNPWNEIQVRVRVKGGCLHSTSLSDLPRPPGSPRERTPFLGVYRNRVARVQQEAATVPRSSQQRAHCTGQVHERGPSFLPEVSHHGLNTRVSAHCNVCVYMHVHAQRTLAVHCTPENDLPLSPHLQGWDRTRLPRWAYWAEPCTVKGFSGKCYSDQ